MAKESIPRLYGLARRLAGDGAEDLVQECLMRSYRSFETLDDPQAGPAWMQRILVNLYRDRLRKEARTVDEVPVEEVDEFSLYRTIADEDPFPYSDSLHLDFLHSFGREDVHAVLMRLPEIYRAPLVLRYIQDFSTKEIARMLDLWDYLDERLSEQEQAQVEQHLAFCRRCCGEMEFAKELQGFLASHGADEIPPDVREHLERLVDEL